MSLPCRPQKCSVPADTYSLFVARSLANNALCGVVARLLGSSGTYTAEGITALCEGLKGSAVTSLT